MAQGKFQTKPTDLARLTALQAKVDLLQARVLELEAENLKLKRKSEHLTYVNQAVISSTRTLRSARA
jgi:hypothetical protein